MKRRKLIQMWITLKVKVHSQTFKALQISKFDTGGNFIMSV